MRRIAIQCMTRQGFHYQPAAATKPSTPTVEHPNPFGLETTIASATAGTEAGPSEIWLFELNRDGVIGP